MNVQPANKGLITSVNPGNRGNPSKSTKTNGLPPHRTQLVNFFIATTNETSKKDPNRFINPQVSSERTNSKLNHKITQQNSNAKSKSKFNDKVNFFTANAIRHNTPPNIELKMEKTRITQDPTHKFAIISTTASNNITQPIKSASDNSKQNALIAKTEEQDKQTPTLLSNNDNSSEKKKESSENKKIDPVPEPKKPIETSSELLNNNLSHTITEIKGNTTENVTPIIENPTKNESANEAKQISHPISYPPNELEDVKKNLLNLQEEISNLQKEIVRQDVLLKKEEFLDLKKITEHQLGILNNKLNEISNTFNNQLKENEKKIESKINIHNDELNKNQKSLSVTIQNCQTELNTKFTQLNKRLDESEDLFAKRLVDASKKTFESKVDIQNDELIKNQKLLSVSIHDCQAELNSKFTKANKRLDESEVLFAQGLNNQTNNQKTLHNLLNNTINNFNNELRNLYEKSQCAYERLANEINACYTLISQLEQNVIQLQSAQTSQAQLTAENVHQLMNLITAKGINSTIEQTELYRILGGYNQDINVQHRNFQDRTTKHIQELNKRVADLQAHISSNAYRGNLSSKTDYRENERILKISEANSKRVEELTENHQKEIERLTNLSQQREQQLLNTFNKRLEDFRSEIFQGLDHNLRERHEEYNGQIKNLNENIIRVVEQKIQDNVTRTRETMHDALREMLIGPDQTADIENKQTNKK